jgi:hypothetical protein
MILDPKVVEEGGKLANTIVNELKTQPVSLALILLNVIFVAFAVFLAHTINQRTISQYDAKDKLIHELLETCLKKEGANETSSDWAMLRAGRVRTYGTGEAVRDGPGSNDKDNR